MEAGDHSHIFLNLKSAIYNLKSSSLKYSIQNKKAAGFEVPRGPKFSNCYFRLLRLIPVDCL
jgi:hypothetical protein